MSKLGAENKNIMYHAVLEMLNDQYGSEKNPDNKKIAQEVVVTLDAMLQVQESVDEIESLNKKKETVLSGPIFKRTEQYQ